MNRAQAEAINRLSGNPDFVEFLTMLAEDTANAERKLLQATDSSLVFRYQGETAYLRGLREQIRNIKSTVDKFRQ
jgi:hypothetical protein